MKEHEKRGATRVTHVSELECESGGARLIARTTDLSTSGVFVHSELCCEPGSILKLKFRVASTQIETSGEVCYSMPQIGMGVRFLDLKPEYRAAIERLVDGRQDRMECEEQNRKIIPSGVEPVDKLLGGVDRGHIYLVHGDASGKSLFGMQFIIDGLKRGQNSALVTPSSPEDAVRRFARLGYDCLEDLYCGRLLIFKYPGDLAEQVLRLRELAPLLRELESMLSETPPERLVFDPVTNLLAAKEDELKLRASEFAAWVRSFGATVLLVANGHNGEVVENLMPLVKDSFRFEVRENGGRAIRFMAFEKSPTIADQAVRVDPSRGVLLLEHQHAHELSDEKIEVTYPSATGIEPREMKVEDDEPVSGLQPFIQENEDQGPEPIQIEHPDLTSFGLAPTDRERTELMSEASVADSLETSRAWQQDSDADIQPTHNAAPSSKLSVMGQATEKQRNALFEMLDELEFVTSSLSSDLAETETDQPQERDQATEPPADSQITCDLIVAGAQAQMGDALSLVWDELTSDCFGVTAARSCEQLTPASAGQPLHLESSSGRNGTSEQRTLSSDTEASSDTEVTLGQRALSGCGNPETRNSESFSPPHPGREPDGDQFISYREFVTRIEDNIKARTNTGSSSSIVGCRLPRMTADGGRIAFRLFELARPLISASDLISTNEGNDLVILLASTDTAGACAFITRLRELVLDEMNQELSVWLRTLPDAEEAAITPRSSRVPRNGETHIVDEEKDNGDDRARSQCDPELASLHAQPHPAPAAVIEPPQRLSVCESYIEFLDRLAAPPSV